MIGRTFSVALVGVEGAVVEVEADLADGLPGLSIIGLPDASLSEARDRIKSAVQNSRLTWPVRKVTLALMPATLPKSGSSYDLALAVAVLAANRSIPVEPLEKLIMIGELGLDGRVRQIRGVLPMVLAANRAGWQRFVVPAANAAEAGLVPDIEVLAVRTLGDVVTLLTTGLVPVIDLDDLGGGDRSVPSDGLALDLSQVGGQVRARRALEVAAAGGHHVFLMGAPGAGKTMLAERLPTILPDLPFQWALEVSAIHSVAGLLSNGDPLVNRPPFRAPHHTVTVAALVGGGSGVLRPGEVSCAHRGVLFLDEAPEFAMGTLDALRQPLESGVVRITRARGSAAFPARVMLVLAANPCPCARATTTPGSCTCSPNTRRRYLAKLSGPLMDRVDLRIQVDPVSRADLVADAATIESSAIVGARVAAARASSTERLRGTPWLLTGDVPSHELRTRWPLTPEVMAGAMRCLDHGQLSARGLDRVVRVAWTLADLAGKTSPGLAEMGEALSMRLEVG